MWSRRLTQPLTSDLIKYTIFRNDEHMSSQSLPNSLGDISSQYLFSQSLVPALQLTVTVISRSSCFTTDTYRYCKKSLLYHWQSPLLQEVPALPLTLTVIARSSCLTTDTHRYRKKFLLNH